MIASQTISTGARPFAGTRVASKFARNGSRVCMKAGNWLPGSDTPAYLENLPASYGFGELLTCRKGKGGVAWLKSHRVCSGLGASRVSQDVVSRAPSLCQGPFDSVFRAIDLKNFPPLMQHWLLCRPLEAW